MDKKTLLILVVLIVVAGAALYALKTGRISIGDKTYSNSTYGIAFTYPSEYELEERAVDSGHTSVTLIHKDNLPVPQNGEGPTAITLDVYRYLGSMGAENWVRTSSNSNFQLSSDGALGVSELDGAEVVTYTWDGLYRGDSVVFVQGEDIVMLSATYLTPEDAIRSDFSNLLATLKLTAPAK